MRAAILLLTSLVAIAQERQWKGEYSNLQYGYRFIIPTGLTCRGAAIDAPAHGCVIEVDGGWVAVNASFRTSDGPPARINAKLDSIPAFESKGLDGKLTIHVVIAIRQLRKGEPPIEYTIDAKCPHQGACSRTFEQIRRSFQLTKTQ